MASTMLAGRPALAADAAATAASTGGGTEIGEVIVTAEKREENLQHVAMSVQALDAKTLTELNVSNFQDYVKFLPSVQFQGSGVPNESIIYMRGVSDGGNGNHSGPLPSVGTYLDEQPITTIGGTLDIHVYDIARVEVLPGPQGTLYGASSESGTLRIITNKPSTAGVSGAVNLTGNVVDHGSEGYVVEGFINVPITQNAAIRIVAFDERDAGFIDNVPGTRPFASSGGTLSNGPFVKNDFNPIDTYGGRAALKFDLNDNWTIMPTVVAQDTRARGTFGFNPAVGDLQVNRFQPDSDHDRWYQAGLTINGKIGRYDLTYAGGYFNRAIDTLTDYTDYSVAYDQAFGSGVFWKDNNGALLPTPIQEIVGRDRFEKGSNELRLASPSTDRFRFIVGLFQERQSHWIIQDYQIQGFGASQLPIIPGGKVLTGPLVSLAVPGWPNTIWLTDEDRVDRDEAVFGEATFDVTKHISITGGIRGYHYNNTLFGFYGYSANYDQLTGFGPGQGPNDSKCIPGRSFRNAPCVNLDKPASTGTGETYKGNLTYKFDDEKLVYFTYSTGYRPGGVNRSGAFLPYQADSLANYEVGWKTSWLDRSLNFNGALYDEEFTNFQFAFLGPNSLTIVENAPSARILGVETSLAWRVTHAVTLSGGLSVNDAELTANFCGTDQSTGLVIPTCPNSQALARKGEQLPYIPKVKGNVTARWAFDVMGWDAHAQVSVAAQSGATPALFIADIGNLHKMPGFATADFSFGAEKDKRSIEVFIKNAFDTRGQLNRYTPCTTSTCAPAYPPGVPAAVYVVPIQPLTIGIRIGQAF
ncbi:MAG TPA: TonB-dependent receptor [Caulobacteraceae bacterium]|nr:TonB-dependent receptor [Caulobacteraceae bacterium]